MPESCVGDEVNSSQRKEKTNGPAPGARQELPLTQLFCSTRS